jgi:hypothetical protein
MVVRYETPSSPGRRTRWMLRQMPLSNAERAARAYTARVLTPSEVEAAAAAMGLPVSSKVVGGAHHERR